jgi:hypothetical protein
MNRLLLIVVKKTPAKRRKRKPKRTNIAVFRGCLTVLAELAGIAGFLLAFYIFLKEYL